MPTRPTSASPQIWFTGNSVARKPHYRLSLINKFPALFYIDGKEVTQDERDRTTAFYSQYTESVYYQTPAPSAGPGGVFYNLPQQQVPPVLHPRRACDARKNKKKRSEEKSKKET